MDFEAGTYARPRVGTGRSTNGSGSSSHSRSQTYSRSRSATALSYGKRSSDTRSHGSSAATPSDLVKEEREDSQVFEGFNDELIQPATRTISTSSEVRKKSKDSASRTKSQSKSKSATVTVTSGTSNNDSVSLASPVDLQFRDTVIVKTALDEDDADRIHGLDFSEAVKPSSVKGP